MKSRLSAPVEATRQSPSWQNTPLQKKKNPPGFTDQRPAAIAQMKLQAMASSSPQAMQLKARMDVSGQHNLPVQRAKEDDLMQGKFQTAQLAKEDELTQGKFDTAQLAKEDELTQGKFEPVQRVEDEEPA
ncbi:hypothetical protein H8L32_16390 [Undibacterium sp. CY18W]|uniref:Uncharacterized protein n=1 Tax=Undibacterium hunanense TaxID=2762292 RepID=A0ABR6ZT88_9BURK|nr:hypothetical protein [Undibacterium hunanense]MBC3919072.1 hypothetical protein [Undibacterium hunanense]